MNEFNPALLRPYGPLLVQLLFWLAIIAFAFSEARSSIAGIDCYDDRRSLYDKDIGLCSCEMQGGTWDANGVCEYTGG